VRRSARAISSGLSSSAPADDPVDTTAKAEASADALAIPGFPAFAGNDHETGRSVADARRRLATAFRGAGLDTPELDARVLVGHGLGVDHATLAVAADRVLTPREAETIAALAARRLAREPVARIVGMKEFWSLSLRLDAAALVPRPETEMLVEAALAAVDAQGARARALRIADLGTGSGALLLALLSELPHASGVGTDTSMAALDVARANARRLGIARAGFVACDYAAALRGPFDLIVCNPPYIAAPAIAGLPPEVRDHDPRAALDGGRDGLDGHRAVAAAASALLAPDGRLIVEIGAGQAPAVATILIDSGLAISELRNDLSGIPRAVSAVKGA
jgi:release factor glutamine methyltransferase